MPGRVQRIGIDWITNIPTPYRNHLYETMARVFPEYGLDPFIHFMAWSEPDRHWRFSDSDLRFPHAVHWGINPRLRGVDFHTNPGLIARVAWRPRPIAVICGYNAPSNVLPNLLIGRRSLRIFYGESHLGSELRSGAAIRSIKRLLVSRCDGFIIPGEPQRQFLTEVAPAVRDRRFFVFPNLIDESVFVAGVAERREQRARIRAEIGVADDVQLWVCPSRLESFKGVDRLLRALDGVAGVRLLIAGAGSLAETLGKEIERRRLPARLLGAVDQDEMVRLYAAADVFVLASLQDPSPLSPIEACAAGLPLVISRAIGNLSDVSDGENAWVIDPMDLGGFAKTLRDVSARPPHELVARGARSAQIYRDRFRTETCVESLAEGIRGLFDELYESSPLGFRRRT